jgi:hypothetical protein
MNKFNIGDTVVWTSTALGHTRTKSGKIVDVIPAGVHPTNGEENKTLFQNKTIHLVCARLHESYLVQVAKRHRLYWPLVSKLEKA